ncbi:MAG: isopeptide-forming domain-containing fimbrial protein, partial [Clostridiales bacterium]|nr:isopeptide-forming domain-containing fimbrial protein [Clostridiales bacterium]
MRKLKQLASVLLALVMCFGLTVTAFADDTYSITVTNPDSGYTYTAYQIFKDGQSDGSSFVANAWGDDITTNAAELAAMYAELEAITVDNSTYPFANIENGQGTVPIETAMVLEGYDNDDEVVQKFAAVVSKYITGSGTTSDSGTLVDSNYNYVISGLDVGYYLVKTTGLPSTGYAGGDNGAYTRYILTTVCDETKGTQSASKSAVPTIDKDLSDVDANIGDTITYYLTATLPSKYADYETYKLVFHDTLSKGLTYANTVKVYVFPDGDYDYKQNLSNGTQVASTSYKFEASDYDSTNGTTITVTLDDTKTLKDTNGNTIGTSSKSLIVVTFTAQLNSDAVIGGAGNPNEVYLEYSNNPNDSGTGNNNTGTTPEDKVVTWTYTLNVTKVDSSTNAGLEDAAFILYRLNSNNEEEYVVLTNGKVSNWTTTETGGTTLTSDADGLFSVIGLDVGTCYLREVTPPSGYRTLANDIELEIKATYSRTDSGTATDDYITLTGLTITADSTPGSSDTSNGTVSTTVANSKAGSLPSTGGIGTTIFYVVGGVLVVGAVVLLITRKRMK